MTTAIMAMTTPLELVLSRLRGVRQIGEGKYQALCPAHDDSTASLSVTEGDDGRVLLNCFAGCGAEQIVSTLGLTMADLFLPKPKPQNMGSSRGITVDELAADKGLPASFLKACGVDQGVGGVKITYKLMDGSFAPRQRWRRALTAKEGSSWLKGNGPPVPYGLWKLAKMRETSDTLTLVEGESDSWTLWHNHIPALGIPGADMTKTLNLTHVEAFPRLYVFKEPDKSGKTFLHGISARLKKIGYSGEVFILRPPEGSKTKDPNDLFKRDPGKFLETWAAVVEAAEAVDLEALETAPEPVTPALSFDLETVNLTDLGNARRLVRRHRQDLRYCYPWEKWLAWDERRWTLDTSGEISRRAKETVAFIYVEAAGLEDEKERHELAKHAMRSESDSRIRAMIHLAESEPGIPAQPMEFDADPWLLNVENGTLDLRSYEITPHSRQSLVTRLAPVAYDPGAECPLWLSFLSRVMDNRAPLIEYLQRVVGYTLTGDTREQCVFMLYGTGSNGKSTFLETLKSLFGDYSQQTDFSTFLHQEQDRVRNDIAGLMGRRFVAAIEADAGRRLAEVLVKQITGGDTVTARFLFREFFEFKPTFKIFLAANSKPAIRGQDNAIWRRIRLIPFKVTILKEEQDKELPLKLRDELPGILAWAVEGCRAWQERGLADPPDVLEATQNYKEEMDILAAFVTERCVVSRAVQATSKALYAEYLKWCEENTEKPLSKNSFSTRLGEKGFESQRLGHDRARGWLGIGLATELKQGPLVDDETPSEESEKREEGKQREREPF